MRSSRPTFFAVSLGLALAAAGCSSFGFGPGRRPTVEPVATASTSQAPEDQAEATSSEEEGQVDIRQFVGPDYCPEMRILDGAELVRRYERGHEDDPNYVIWQASFGETARECLYEQDGTLTLKVGVSGRIVTGPKGGPGDVTVPFKLAVVKFKESVLTTEAYSVAVTIPPRGSTTFSRVEEMTVPSPGNDRDYILYLGFDVGEWDLQSGVVTTPQPKQPPPPPPPPPEAIAQPAPQAPKPAQPNVLPTPSDGFVLPR